MEIKVGNYVKTYDLCTGKIKIGIIKHIFDKDDFISCWRSYNELKYESEQYFKNIPSFTAIWDKRCKRWLFRYAEQDIASFSTVIVDVCPMLEPLLISEEKVIFSFED